ncbi:DivIVA domain-containing protein [uncultured Eubacterium sp.]|uniref:DivIVA domain-containing protein n=1 Tax=uncultured Eubacterium sp. TaxID=165185 RepID=UPI00265CD02E|nr:DivIVA domain-containing protein [uncultured Eubacterium sp.]
MANEEKTTIENLRKDLENEHRFTSVWRGYNKKEVNDYLQNMENEQARRIEEERNSAKEEQERSKELILQIQKQNQKIQELQKKLDNRDATEKSVVQKMMDELKETNSKLMKENSRKQMEIANFEERITKMREDVTNYTAMLSALDKRLKELLNEKMDECNNIIDTWERQFLQTKNGIEEKLK